MSATIGSICHESNTEALDAAKTYLNGFAGPAANLEIYPVGRSVRNTTYYGCLLAAVLDVSNPRVGFPSGDPDAPGVQNLVPETIHKGEYFDVSGWTKVNGKIDESRFEDKRAWSCVRPLPRIFIPPSVMSALDEDPNDPFVSQLWDVLEPPAADAGRYNTLVCVNISACVYFIRKILSAPIPDDEEERAQLRRMLRSIEDAANAAQSAIRQQFNYPSPPVSEASNRFRSWVATNSINPIDTLDVSNMVGKGRLPDDAQECYLLAVREHLLAIIGLAVGMSP